MNEKKQNQAVLLDNLVYLTCKIEEDAVTHEIKKVLVDPTKFDNVGKYVQKLIDDGEEGCLIKDEDGTERYPGSIEWKEWKEWKEVLNAIKADKELSSMKISECYDRQNAGSNDQFEKYLDKKFGKNRYSGETKIMVFTKGDSKKDSFVIFRGTAGDKEWADNTLLYQRGDTPANKEALAYMNYLS